MSIDGREHYRNTAAPVRFFIFEALAAVPLPLIWFLKSWSAVFIALATLAFFFFLEKKGLLLINFLRRTRCKISGNHKAVSHSKRRYI